MAGYKYISPSGEFIEGIPARDLSDAEFRVLTQEHQESVRVSGLYRPEPEPQAEVKVAVRATAVPAPEKKE